MPTIAEQLSTLAACMCGQLATSPSGAPATCCVLGSGGVPVVPNCCPGFAWVRQTSISPTDAFPANGYTPARCMPPAYVIAIEMGVSRCAAEVCDPLGNPCCSSEATALENSLGDFIALQQALLCCFPEGAGLRLDEVELGTWTPGEPSGGCVASTMTGSFRFTF